MTGFEPGVTIMLCSGLKSRMFLYHNTPYLSDILRSGTLRSAYQVGNSNQNPSSECSPYVFFNTFPRSELCASGGLAGYSRNVGLVFDTRPFLGKTLYMSQRHTGGRVSSEDVTKHRFETVGAMNRALRLLYRRSMRVVKSLSDPEMNSGMKSGMKKGMSGAENACAFQEVFTRYNPRMSDVRYLLFSTAPSTTLVQRIRETCPKAQIVVHVPSETYAIREAYRVLEVIRVEGQNDNTAIGDYVRTRIGKAIDGLSPYTATSAKVRRMSERLRRALIGLGRKMNVRTKRARKGMVGGCSRSVRG